MSTNDEQVPTSAEGLTIHQAALQLGMSESTIRRRIKDGSLKASRIPTSQGFEWRILLDEQTPVTSGEQVATNDGEVPTIGEQVLTNDDQLATITDQAVSSVMEQLQPLLEQLSTERDRENELQRQNVELAARCGYLQARLEAAEQRVLALSAPTESQEERPRAPWWRWLLGIEPA